MKIGSYGYMNIITHLPTFLCGVMAFLLWRRTGYVKSTALGAVLLAFTLAMTLVLVYTPFTYHALLLFSGVRMDLYIWSFLFMILILSICFWPNRFLVNKLSTGMGRISFSLYLWHPLIIILSVSLYEKTGEALGPGLWNFVACTLLTIGIVSLISIVSFRIIETPGIKYGKRLANEY